MQKGRKAILHWKFRKGHVRVSLGHRSQSLCTVGESDVQNNRGKERERKEC